jgi:hypothetical protein
MQVNVTLVGCGEVLSKIELINAVERKSMKKNLRFWKNENNNTNRFSIND